MCFYELIDRSIKAQAEFPVLDFLGHLWMQHVGIPKMLVIRDNGDLSFRLFRILEDH